MELFFLFDWDSGDLSFCSGGGCGGLDYYWLDGGLRLRLFFWHGVFCFVEVMIEAICKFSNLEFYIFLPCMVRSRYKDRIRMEGATHGMLKCFLEGLCRASLREGEPTRFNPVIAWRSGISVSLSGCFAPSSRVRGIQVEPSVRSSPA